VRKAFTLVATLLLVGITSQQATAQSDRVRVRQMLSGYETIPGRAQWRAMGSDTLRVLVALYSDPSEPAYVRLRSVSVAAHYPIPATRTFLRAVLAAPQQSDLFLRQALLAMARAFGASAKDDVAPFLTHPEPVAREAAVQALDEIGTDDALALLRPRLQSETHLAVRDALRRALD